jgi:hypothetical protein
MTEPQFKSFPKPSRPYRSPKARQDYRKRHPVCEGCRKRRSEEVHHLVSRIMSGSDHDSNLLALCHSCHAEWSGINRTRREWLAARQSHMTEEAVTKVRAALGLED